MDAEGVCIAHDVCEELWVHVGFQRLAKPPLQVWQLLDRAGDEFLPLVFPSGPMSLQATLQCSRQTHRFYDYDKEYQWSARFFTFDVSRRPLFSFIPADVTVNELRPHPSPAVDLYQLRPYLTLTPPERVSLKPTTH